MIEKISECFSGCFVIFLPVLAVLGWVGDFISDPVHFTQSFVKLFLVFGLYVLVFYLAFEYEDEIQQIKSSIKSWWESHTMKNKSTAIVHVESEETEVVMASHTSIQKDIVDEVMIGLLNKPIKWWLGRELQGQLAEYLAERNRIQLLANLAQLKQEAEYKLQEQQDILETDRIRRQRIRQYRSFISLLEQLERIFQGSIVEHPELQEAGHKALRLMVKTVLNEDFES